jgi:hypothetical protein
MYDYFLGGKDHFAADREVAGKVLATTPMARTSARENRAFLGRAVRFLADEAGIRQFLDIGTGLPTTNNTHEVAQAVVLQSLVVSAGNGKLCCAHETGAVGLSEADTDRLWSCQMTPRRNSGDCEPGLRRAFRSSLACGLRRLPSSLSGSISTSA